MMMFLVKVDSARALIKYLLGPQLGAQQGVGNEFTDMDLSALREVGNILSSAYLNALSSLISKKAIPSVPYLAKDMAGAIMSVPAIEFGKIADKVLFIESVFGTDDEEVSGYFILVPDLQSFRLILSSLGVE
jgi:chemotaxis protein CheC